MSRIFCILSMCWLLPLCPMLGRSTAAFGASGLAAAAASPPANVEKAGQLFWYSDYATAVDAAKREGKMLLLFFYDADQKQLCDRFQRETFTDPEVLAKLKQVVRARLPLGATIQSGGKEVVLLKHFAFAGMLERPGVAIIDFFHQHAQRYGRVVATVPLQKDRRYTIQDMAVLLELPSAAPRQPVDDELGRRARKSQQPPPGARRPTKKRLFWYRDYAVAREVARREGKMLLVYFCRPDESQRLEEFERETLCDPQIAERLEKLVRVKLPVDTKIQVDGEEVGLLKQSAFAEMQGLPGMAIIDFARKDAPYYGCVVSAFPFLKDEPYTIRQVAVILDLPPGTLTQRTLIYAVRTHPDRPASTDGQVNPDLATEAESHSQYQARIRRQGHHRWESRFHRINGKLPHGLTASEVCAESWPGQRLLQAAIECVRCWRLSSGHWRAVRAPHPYYGYDMKRGSNGVWYATGIFAEG